MEIDMGNDRQELKWYIALCMIWKQSIAGKP